MRALVAAILALFSAPAAAAVMQEDDAPRNIVVMIADGAGYNMLAATRYWHGRKLTADGKEWQRAALATYALRREAEPSGLQQDPRLVYNSASNWDAAPLPGRSSCAPDYPAGFAGYEWNRCTHPDSANTMTAMMTGVRSYNGAINVDGTQVPVLSAAEVAKASGRRVGVVSSVPFTHATPAAGGGAHNADRSDYHEIAEDMLGGDTLDFIAGGGNPDFDSAGNPVAADAKGASNRWISAESWRALQDGSAGWQLFQTRGEIARLADAPVKGRVIALPQIAATLQVERPAGVAADSAAAIPGETPLLSTVPTLAELTRAALTQLQGDEGMFLIIEGGAVDWAMHANSLGRAIEEYTDFDEAVRAVEAWVDDPASSANWENTLVIVTADHDHLLLGPDAATVPFQAVEGRGAGVLPGHSWWSGTHSNQLVPIYARGAGSALLMAQADEMDQAIMDGRATGRGAYLTQPEMGQVLIELIGR